MRKLTPVIILLLFISATISTVFAQPVRNLNFEEPGIVNPNQPVGWSTRWVGYELSLDSLDVHSGKFSLKTERLPDHDSGYAISRQNIAAVLLRGKDLEVHVWMRSENIQNGNVVFRIAVFDEDSDVLEFIQFPEGGITGTTEWNQYTAKTFISEDAKLISLDAFHNGEGKAWVDNVKVYIDGEKYDPDSYVPWSATTDQIKWLKENTIPLSTDSPGSNFSDLDQLKPLFEDAEIVGLGEATHGTREFFQMKHRIVEWIAQQQDTVIFAIEANMPESRAINEYIRTGNGDPKELLAELHYWTWNTEEVLQLIEWMRNYNESEKGKVEFWGFDMTFPRVAADSVRSFIEKADPMFLEELEKSYEFPDDPEEFRSMNDNDLIEIQERVQSVKEYLSDNKVNYLKNYDTKFVEWVIQYARIVEQSVSRFTPNGNSRDESMAENINWIYEQKKGNSPLLLWAHNSHIARSDNGFGKLLAEQFGDDYVNVGFSFGEGNYSAVLGPNEPVASYPSPLPKEGSVEYVFQSVDIPIFALNLDEITNNPNSSWLKESKPIKSIGSVARDDPYRNIPVAEFFNIMIYFDQTSASHSFGKPDPGN
ncbi:MAG: erythromycin esterase family protein [Gracilimonas sp.]